MAVSLEQFEDYLEGFNPAVRTIIEKSSRDVLAGRSRRVEELLIES